MIMMAFVVVFALGMVRSQAADEPKPHSMIGCLAVGTDPGTYKLTNVEKGPMEVDIAETTAKLDPHIGHKVEMTGVKIKGKNPKAHTMRVTEVKMIAPTCP